MRAAKRAQQLPLEIACDEATVIPSGTTGYWLLLNEGDADQMALGRVPPEVVERCQQMLSWKTENEAKELIA